MGADLFGSFAEASCAAMVISSQSQDLFHEWTSMNFPLVLISCGVFASFATSFVATHIVKVRSAVDVEASLKRQLVVSTVLMTAITFGLCMTFFPSTFDLPVGNDARGKSGVKNWHIFFCVMCGLWSGLLIGFVTEYYTSHSYTPVREVANACKTGGQ
jgi:Na+/H+-translocating membrane pyrophosphatase